MAASRLGEYGGHQRVAVGPGVQGLSQVVDRAVEFADQPQHIHREPSLPPLHLLRRIPPRRVGRNPGCGVDALRVEHHRTQGRPIASSSPVPAGAAGRGWSGRCRRRATWRSSSTPGCGAAGRWARSHSGSRSGQVGQPGGGSGSQTKSGGPQRNAFAGTQGAAMRAPCLVLRWVPPPQLPVEIGFACPSVQAMGRRRPQRRRTRRGAASRPCPVRARRW